MSDEQMSKFPALIFVKVGHLLICTGLKLKTKNAKFSSDKGIPTDVSSIGLKSLNHVVYM